MEETSSNPLLVIERRINELVTLHIINIKSFSAELKAFIDKWIIEIYSKDKLGDDISSTKRMLIDYLASKRDSSQELGAISEFFLHLHLNEIGYRQEFLYQNLEERAPKKGFDGYYSKDSEEWLVESKSGKAETKDISHNKKIQEAFNDLSSKLAGKSTNNPWRNALTHATLAKSEGDILKNIKKLSENYSKDIYADIKDFNVIPGSTIFLDGQGEKIPEIEDPTCIEEAIKNWLSKKEYKKMHIVCITKGAKDIFWEYLKS